MANTTDTVTTIYRIQNQMQAELKAIKEEMKGYNKTAKESDEKTNSLSGGFKKLAGAIGLMSVAYKGLKAGKDAVDMFKKQETASARLESIAKNVTKATDAQVDSLKNLADETQKYTTFGDEVIETGQSQLLSFGVSTESAKKLTGSFADLIAANNGVTASTDDAINNANLMGKALNGQAGALSRVGILLDERQAKLLKEDDEATRVNTLIEIMDQNYGGLAKTLAATPEGIAQQQANEMGDLAETIGKDLLPIEESWIKIQKDSIKLIKEMSPAIKVLVSGFGVFADLLSSIFQADRILLGVTALSVGVVGLSIAIEAGTITWAKFNAVVAANPIGLAAIAAAGLLITINQLNKAQEDLIKTQVEFGKASADTQQKTYDNLLRITELENKRKKSGSEKKELKTLKKAVEAVTGEKVKFNKTSQEAFTISKTGNIAIKGVTTSMMDYARSIRNTEAAEHKLKMATIDKTQANKASAAQAIIDEENEKKAVAAKKRLAEQTKKASSIIKKVLFDNAQFTRTAQEREIAIVQQSANERKKVLIEVYGKTSTQVAAIEQQRVNKEKEINDKYAENIKAKAKTIADNRISILSQMVQDKSRAVLTEEQFEIASIEKATAARKKQLESLGANNKALVENENIKQLQIQEVKDKYSKIAKEKEEKDADEKLAKQKETLTTITNFTQLGINSIQSLVNAGNTKRNKELDARVKKEIDAVNDSTKSEKEKAKAIEKIEKKAAADRLKLDLREWRNSLIMSGVNTAQAVTKTFAQLGFPTGIPMGAAVAVAGGIQTGIIASQKPQAMATGGMLEDQSGILMGGGSTQSDSIPFRGNGGETVVSKRGTNNLTKAIDEGNFGGGGKSVSISIPITIQGNASDATVAALEKTANDMVDLVVRSLEIADEDNKIDPSRFTTISMNEV